MTSLLLRFLPMREIPDVIEPIELLLRILLKANGCPSGTVASLAVARGSGMMISISRSCFGGLFESNAESEPMTLPTREWGRCNEVRLVNEDDGLIPPSSSKGDAEEKHDAGRLRR